jgi:hypothetical protein
MKRAISAALLFFSLSVSSVFAADAPNPSTSKPPASAPTAAKQSDTLMQTQVQIVGTDQAPIVVKMTPQPVDESQRAEARSEREEDKAERETENKEKSKNDNAMIGWTVVLAFVGTIQAGVFIWQGGSLRDTFKEMEKGTAATEKLAGAAEKHALAVEHAERAYLFFEFPDGPTIVPLQKEGLVEISIELDIVNHGRTPAELIQVRAYPIVAISPPTEFIDSPGSKSELPPGKAIASGQSIHLRLKDRITASELENMKMKNSGVWVYCLGSVKYWDIFREEVRETSICAFFSDGEVSGVRHTTFIPDPRSTLNKRT